MVARALRRRRMLLDDGERPLRLLFAGPSGVGKTAMATALCEAVFGAAVPDRNFKRFNLSEYSHPSKFNRLTGGDPNYVGYKEGGELTNFIRQAEERRAGRKSAVSHTSCVVLLDEVDRAADGLLTFLMNFLDQGQLTDGRGDTVDARRAIIVMTTNVGTDTIAALEGADDALLDAEAGDADYAAYAGSGQSLQDAVVERIRGDVLEHVCDGRWENLGRLGNIVPFLPLDGAGRRSVIDRQLTALADRAAKADPPLALRGYSTALLDHVAAHWDAKLGGRSTRDYIEEHVVEAVAEALDGAPRCSTARRRSRPSSTSSARRCRCSGWTVRRRRPGERIILICVCENGLKAAPKPARRIATQSSARCDHGFDVVGNDLLVNWMRRVRRRPP